MTDFSPASNQPSSSLKSSIKRLWRSWLNNIDSWIRMFRAAWPRLMHRLWLTGASTTLLAVAVLSAAFLWPDKITYSLAHQVNCVDNPVLLPNLLNSSQNSNYHLQSNGQVKLLGYPIFSTQTCASVKSAEYSQAEQQITLSHPLLPFAAKRLNVVAPPQISVKLGRPMDLPVATSGAMVFHLSSPDQTFNYQLSVGDRRVVCAQIDLALLCNLDRLGLKQGRDFEFRLERLFAGELAGSVFEKTLKTVNPVTIVKSSVKPKQTVQNIPTKLTLTTNKVLADYSELELNLLEDGKSKPVEITVETKGQTLNVIFAQPLKRRVQFELKLKDLTAQDGGYLLKPYSLRFNTSGGPRVAAANIGSYAVGTNHTIVVSLDSQPKGGQNLKKFISVDGKDFNYSLSISGKQIYISPTGSWPRCTSFSVNLKDGLQNKYGVSGGSDWQLNSRTLCQQISYIGSSVDGRGIYAYRFGGGSHKVIFVGGTHGDESSSVHNLNSWIDNLEANYGSIPSGKTIIVVPNINPDGYACGCRVNSRDVDLNRNFPANDWKKDVIMPGGELNKGGGGKTPLSEPESSALASYVLNQNPDLVLTYHAVGSLVIANESGNSSSLAVTYGQHSGFQALNNSEIGGIFSHDTTGAFEDWLHDKHGIPALLIELSSYGGNEFWNHQNAMWAMVRF